MKQIFILSAAFVIATSAWAMTPISFETEDYAGLSVYDAWESSPFRAGTLHGNWGVVDNPDRSSGADVTEKCAAVQRSRYGSNTFGLRINLKEPFSLTRFPRTLHVKVWTPVPGRVMVIGLGKRRDRPGQSAETEQFMLVTDTVAAPGEWHDAVFAVKGSEGVDIHSLVIVPHCESPHDLEADFIAYIDEIRFE